MPENDIWKLPGRAGVFKGLEVSHPLDLPLATKPCCQLVANFLSDQALQMRGGPKKPARSCVLATVLFSACCRISTIEAETDLENGKPSAQKSEPTLTLKGTFTRTQPASKSFNALSSPMVESNLPSCESSVHFIHVQYTDLQ